MSEVDRKKAEKAEYDKKYRAKNKEKKRAGDKIYRENHKEEREVYLHSPAGIKSRVISDWKRRGVICEDLDTLYERYLNTKLCELCNVELTTGKRSKTSKCLDHCHETGEIRNIVCHSCNVKRR